MHATAGAHRDRCRLRQRRLSGDFLQQHPRHEPVVLTSKTQSPAPPWGQGGAHRRVGTGEGCRATKLSLIFRVVWVLYDVCGRHRVISHHIICLQVMRLRGIFLTHVGQANDCIALEHPSIHFFPIYLLGKPCNRVLQCEQPVCPFVTQSHAMAFTIFLCRSTSERR